MIQTITRMDKFSALRRIFKQRGMLDGTVDEYMAQQFAGSPPPIRPWGSSAANGDGDEESDSDNDSDNEDGPTLGPKTETVISLASTSRKFRNSATDTS